MYFKQSNEVFKGDIEIIDSLDSEASRIIFTGLIELRPTLEMALREANIKNHDIVLQNSRIFANAARKNPEIAKLGLSDDEAGAISCYTLQGIGDAKSPYEVINEGLARSRNKTGLASTGRLLFLLLSGLRKLPRTRPSAGQVFYRGVDVKVPRTRDEANGHQYYEKGRIVTWWGFTSTTANVEVVNDFIQGASKASTLFNIGGEDLWGYVIKAFSQYKKEDEILLEPEAKVLVGGAVDSGTLLTIVVTLQPFSHLVLEDIIPVGNASSVPTQIGQPQVTKTYSGGSFSEAQGKGAFYNQTFNMQKKWECAWKECPPYVNQMVRYSISPYNPRVAAKMVPGDNCYCTIIGNSFVPLNTVTLWSVKVLSSRENNGHSIYVGVAPSDINQNGYDYNTMYGWYLHCQDSTLWSGFPHNYRGMAYQQQQMMGFGGCMNVGVLVDTIKGELSFVLNGVNLGVAYERIPLNKPLVPCVLLWKYGDSVELDISEATNENSSIPVPSNLAVKNVTHDSITLTWDEIGAATYEIEVDGSKLPEPSSANTFVKGELLPETEHSFRVRTVRGSSVSEWNGVVKGKTLKWECTWKKSPDDVDDKMKYSVDERNPRIATKINEDTVNDDDDCCTIIGNAHIPLNKVTSWNIKILKSENDNGDGVYIGVAPFNINQNVCNYNRCGWYFNCYESALYSGPPHDYRNKEYGPRKDDGRYVHTGDSIGVVVDTTKGELLFVLNSVNYGVAYKGIPLDKPLVPCVILKYEGDSVELDFSEVKEKAVNFFSNSSNIITKSTTWDSIALTWDEVTDASFYQIEVDGNKFWDISTTNSFVKGCLLPETEHSFRVRTVRGSIVSEWSGVVKERTLKWECAWKKCPDYVDNNRKYNMDGRNLRIATKVNDYGSCTIIGNTTIPLNKVTSWSIKVLKSKKNDGDSIFIGIAPFDINQNEDDNCYKCGWYFSCYDSELCSGPPHKYDDKEYGPRKEKGQYVHNGDSMGIVMDTTKGDLSFVLDGVNLGVAYEGIPLDKPLVPCVILYYQGDSVELDTSEVKENEVDSSISVLSNVTVKNITWDTTTLTWDKVEGASFYQIEVDGSNPYGVSTTNTFTKRGLLPDTEHCFRVRTVKGSSVGEWSGVVKGRTLKAPEFSDCVWKTCPDDVYNDKKYSVGERNPRIATKINDDYPCTIIGNTHIPLNKVTSWSAKILKSRDNNGLYIRIGVAPFDINQDEKNICKKCGWYFDCYRSVLRSGPPHNYCDEEYGPRKGYGQYVRTGDSVGVLMNTIKGELSFVLDGVNLGVAYGGIPLDKPLVPCVLLYWQGDSVELDTSEVKENEVDNSIPVPSNITAKSGSTWGSITLTWDKVTGASFYQIEVDGSISWDASTTNAFTKRGLCPETEHSFRVRTVKGSSVSEWSDVVKGRASKESFETGWWKECPGDVYNDRKYSVDERNPRVATKTSSDNDDLCIIIGNTSIPLNTVTPWSIKVLRSKDNNGYSIFIGVAQNDINQNVVNYDNIGWYFDCYSSSLFSGPPHNYYGKEYGPRKENGQYVHTVDSVGVVMDTTKGELSFILNGVNLGVAYEGIPLDKPLVPCVLLKNYRDSVELDLSEAMNVDSSISVPSNIITKSTWDSITLAWDEVADASSYQVEVDESKPWDVSTSNSFIKRGFLPESEHSFRVRTVRGSSVSEWSGVMKGRTLKAPEFPECVWKKCLDDVYDDRKYSVDGKNLRIATNISSDYDYCTIIGDTHIPLNAVTSWSIKILRSKKNNGNDIFIGIAPSDINQNDDDWNKCGWYFYCYDSALYSGPPHKHRGKAYGPRKDYGQYVHTGDSVGVVVDTTKGDLSFVVNGVNLGVAYEVIPLDKPLVPCAILGNKGDSVELNLSEENEVDSSIPIPSDITAKSITWGSITLTWDKVADASFYQVEVDGSKSWDVSTANSSTKRGLLPETEHSFRVRTVRGTSVGEWSGVVKGRTLEKWECVWKECPDYVDEDKKYGVDGGNPRIATKVNNNGYGDSTIIGNAHIALNAVTSWSIKVLESEYNDGSDIYIGIAPNDINQNADVNFNKCGWYFNCYYSVLRSGPPHKYSSKEYGPRKDGGQYVHTGDSVGVVVDTIKGEISFFLNCVNLGVAYEGIPLDKPLVPCVILKYEGDSVEFDTSEVKENVGSSIPIPSDITAKSTTWDSITLAWDKADDASFYQIEVDGIKSWNAVTTNTYTWRGLLPETEHSFRVRTVRGSSVSEWSSVVRGRTLKAPEFSDCVWKTCPDCVDIDRKYSVDGRNPRVATKVNNNYCTIIGDIYIPLSTVVSWNIKILKSKKNDGSDIYVGIAPNDINQNDVNYDNIGWYFVCGDSTLYSGPPHNYRRKKYGPRKHLRSYVHTGDSVGVVVDTKKGELSFVLNGVNLGIAFEGIPLDKPLVPCVLLYHKGDSVELVI